MRHSKSLLPHPKGSGVGNYYIFHDGMGHRIADCRSLWKQLQELMDWGYLKEFILNPGQSSEVKVQKRAPETQIGDLSSHTLVSYKEVEALFGACPLEGHHLEREGHLHQRGSQNKLSNGAERSPLCSRIGRYYF